jgi:hypothetical protein
LVVWTCVVAVLWVLGALAALSDDSTSCEESTSWICLDTGDIVAALALYAFVLWLFGVLVVAVGVGLVRVFRRLSDGHPR